MPWFGWVLLLGFALAAFYVYLAAPSVKRVNTDSLTGKLYAHRGLHDGNRQIYENSMAAFSLAADVGYGIEMDVQLTRDHVLVIHHDASTARICGVDRVITQTDYADLPKLPDGSSIPMFKDFLALIAGRIPLVVEIKSHGDHHQTAAATLKQLQNYQGAYCIESFAPDIVGYVRRHAPGVIRGQLASGRPYTAKAGNMVLHFAHKHLLYNYLGRPHFIAYDCKNPLSPSVPMAKRFFGTLLVAWTVKDQPTLDTARKRYDAWIFEGFTPDEPKS